MVKLRRNNRCLPMMHKPSKLSIGTVTIIIVHRDDRYALRIKDSLAPTRTELSWLEVVCTEYFIPDFRRNGFLMFPQRVLDIPTILGTVGNFLHRGGGIFADGKTMRASRFWRNQIQRNCSFIMRDTTSKASDLWGRSIHTQNFQTSGPHSRENLCSTLTQVDQPSCAFTAAYVTSSLRASRIACRLKFRLVSSAIMTEPQVHRTVS